MGWRRALVSDREKIIALLRQREWEHLPFSSAVKDQGTFRVSSRGTVYILNAGEGGLKGALFISKGGALHCCFEPKDLTRRDLNQLKKIILSRRFFSFIGREDRIRMIENIYGDRNSFSVDYFLMVKERGTSLVKKPPQLPMGVVYRLAVSDDSDDLYPLEKAYQLEEVVRDPESLNESFLKRNFRDQLDREIIWLGESAQGICCKGGTNAIGFDFCQLGGVYTLPEMRGRGVGTGLILHLDHYLNENRWGSALFVRKSNGAAIRVYEKCGFTQKNTYRIVYPQN